MCCLDNEKDLYSASVGAGTFTIISDAAVTSNKLNQQIKQAAQTTALSQKCDQLNNIGSRFGVPVLSCISLKHWVQMIAKLCNLLQIFATQSRGMKPNSK